MVTGIHCLHSVNGRVEHLAIYKRGQNYGPLNDEIFKSVKQCVAVLSRTGLIVNDGATFVTLTNQLFPDK